MPFFGVPIRNGLPIGLGSVAGFGVQQFDPSQLFEGGTVAGAWYDPSDLSTMFTTSAGTTPVAMPGQGAAVPVGLMLDKSQGLVLGANVLGSVWSTLGGAVASGSSVTFNSVSDIAAFQSVMTAGVRYLVSFDYNITSGQAGLYVGTNGGTGAAIIDLSGLSGTGSFSGYFIAGTALFIFRDLSGCVASFTNITLRAQLGNHAISFNNTTARPELRARVNLLTYSEEFNNGAWTKSTVTVTANATTAPNGTLTADRLDAPNSTTTPVVVQNLSAAIGAANVALVYAKKGTHDFIQIRYNGDVVSYVNFDLANKTVGTTGGTITSASINVADNGWYVCQVSNSSALVNGVAVLIAPSASATRNQAGTYLGTETVFLWGADLRPANIGANVPAYQRIADANTYDTNGFPLYLRFDGIDDSMYTPASIPFATVTSDGQARRNLLSFPTAFDDAAWLKTNVTVAANATAAPDGTTTADNVIEGSGVISPQIYQSNTSAGVQYTYSAYVKANGRSFVGMRGSYVTNDNWISALFNLSAETATLYAGSGSTGLNTAASVTNVGNGWYRISYTFTPATGHVSTTTRILLSDGTAPSGAGGVISYTGDGTSGIYLWGAQLELGSTATAFQNIGTDKVAVFAGVRKLSDAARGMVVEFAQGSGQIDAFNLSAPAAASATYSIYSGGTIPVGPTASAATFAAPISNVLTFQSSISAPSMTLRANTIEIINNASTQGTGNFGTYPLFIGARNNSSLWFNGHLYSLLVAGNAVSAGNISATEQWVAGKTGIVL